jgi:hypothetical protein
MLQIILTDGVTHKGRSGVVCICDCGAEFTTRKYYVQKGRITSCGCKKTERGLSLGKKNVTHGLTQHALYSTWHNMMRRCYSTSCDRFHHYGGRGISVHEAWHSVETFIFDVTTILGPKPLGHEIDRIDNHGNYCPENVRWASKTEQNRNKRSNLQVTIDGTTRCLKEWSIATGIPYTTLHGRYSRGITGHALLSRQGNTR